MNAPFCPARASGLHLHASNDTPPARVAPARTLIQTSDHGRQVDGARHEAPRMFQPDFGIERAAPRRSPWRWLPWVLFAASLAANVGFIARLAVIGGHL